MHFLGRFLKYLLRSAFSIIIFLLFIGWSKMGFNTSNYIGFLNANDWSVFHWSKPATWVDPFWMSNQSGSIAELLSSDTVDAELSGIDVYDPAFEADLNTIPDGGLTGSSETDFGGFTTETQPADTTGSN